tara:strand:- start:37 stop:1014 length:978 start_codon:yes stop_codon:yes gene_type:complete
MVENIIRINLIKYFDTNFLLSNIFSISASIAVAYILNVNFNFKVPKERIKISLFYFTVISIFSCIVQFTFSYVVDIEFFQNRFQISGALFLIAYFLHRRYTFKNYQKIGVAIHLNKSNNVLEIFNKVKNFPDFIHIDLIDETYNSENISIDIEMLNKIRELWPQKKLQIHLMSKNPNFWISQLPKSRNTEVFFHYDENVNIEKISSLILSKNFIPGVVLHNQMSESQISKLMNLFSNFMVLCVGKAGFSGQVFQNKYSDLINKLIKISEQVNDVKITLDGGITPKIASKFNVQEVVSASSILNDEDSKKQIINFQTSQKYQDSEQ